MFVSPNPPVLLSKISFLICHHKKRKFLNFYLKPQIISIFFKLVDYFLNTLLPVHRDLPPWVFPTRHSQAGKILSLFPSILCRTTLISGVRKPPGTGGLRSQPHQETLEPLSLGEEVPKSVLQLPGSGRSQHSFPGSSGPGAQPEPGLLRSR